MDVVERLTLEAAQADTMLACEHRHRYEFAARLCAGRRVLDLCCGSGYGTAILSTRARAVVGLDHDAATIETAEATVGREAANASFELTDALAGLRADVAGRFDVVVCFEGLEHLTDLERALELLRAHAESGVQIVASVPNGKLFGEQNPFHVTEFGYDEAIAAFKAFPRTVMVPQFLAEGSLICPPGAPSTGAEVTLTLDDRDEPEYANHFVFCVNFDSAAVEGVHHGRIQLSTAPVFNRWAQDLKRGAWALRRENARLARARLGKAGSAAASALAGLADREAHLAGLQQRCRAAEARVSELEAALLAVEAPREAPTGPPVEAIVVGGGATESAPLPEDPGGDPNSWEQRRRRAADVLIPWIEQTVPLAGKTVLEYGCGNAAVSCAFAARADRVIGVDIDSEWIELAREQVAKRGITNVELELHPLASILDAVAARRGEIDVFLCYAVLEHLTVPERLAVLRLAREVVKPDGAIVVCETPNRLIYFDHHTAQIPFFHLLPDELAAAYYQRSEREDFTAAIDAAAAQGSEAALEAIVRWGRGVSYHEFELVFADRLDQHVIASNYDPILFPERPIHPDEVILARYLERWRPDLAPVWSRYWLDLILSPRPVAKRPPFLRPWSAETLQSHNVGWTSWENLHLSGPDATLWVELPHATSRLVVGSVTREGAPLALHVRSEAMVAPLRALAQAPTGHTAFTSFELPAPAQRIAVGAGGECHLVFVGYED
ncbi:MAG: class I SAM-dependent methyltransferase [Solirubrobacteraceae bacterium]